jgi:GNAT superfamily N-acetyltransferase
MNAPPPTGIRIEPVIGALPPGFDALAEEARAEGHRMIDRLAADWAERRILFDGPGERLLAVFAGDVLAAIGGLTRDPVVPAALRMRRFYVRPAFRRHGIGRILVNALLVEPRRTGRTVVTNAGKGSEPFWEAFGFLPEAQDGHTHILLARADADR